MNRLQSIILAALAVLLGVIYLLPANPVSAQSSASLSIAPKKNYVIEPGESIQDTLVVRNLDVNQPLELTLRVVDFTFTDNGGTPKLFLDEDTPQTTWSMKPFIAIPTNVIIAPGSSKTIDMSVAIPAGQGAGSYYSAIIYGTGSGEGGNVGLSASGVTLVFTTIPGLVTENLILKKFGLYDPAANGDIKGYQFITEQQPSTIAYTLENEGNVAEAPVGSITLKDLFGRERVIDNVNPSGSLALIGQTRTYQACIKLASQNENFQGNSAAGATCVPPGLWPGYYTADLSLFYGQNGNLTKEVTGVASFWYLPWWFVIAFLVLLTIITVVVWRLVVIIRLKLYGIRSRKSLRRRR
jgi:hypothetical protein